MYTFEFIDRPGDGFQYRRATDRCVIMHKRHKIGEAVDAFWAQKIVDALNKADAS